MINDHDEPRALIKSAGLIPEFPKFTRLTPGYRVTYEKLIQQYPAVTAFSFIRLVDWWEKFGEARVATLDGNLVISLTNYGDERLSGLSFVGTKNVDASFAVLFDFLKQNEFPAKIVSVPEFVMHNVEYPELFKVTPMTRDDEYIIRADRFASLEELSRLRGQESSGLYEAIFMMISKYGQ